MNIPDDIRKQIEAEVESLPYAIADAPIEYNNNEAYCWLAGRNEGYKIGRLKSIEVEREKDRHHNENFKNMTARCNAYHEEVNKLQQQLASANKEIENLKGIIEQLMKDDKLTVVRNGVGSYTIIFDQNNL